MELAIGILIGIFLGLLLALGVVTIGARRKLAQLREVGTGLDEALRHLRLAEDVLATDAPELRLVDDLPEDIGYGPNRITPESS